MLRIRPFVFRKTAAPGRHDDNDSGDHDDEGEENPDTATKKNKAAGTIALELYRARLRAASKGSSTTAKGAPVNTGYTFKECSAVPDKKDSFGIEQSVGVGATTTGERFSQSPYTRSDFIEKLEVRYRTAKFFHTLQCRIDPPGIACPPTCTHDANCAYELVGTWKPRGLRRRRP